ncbi:MAG TPA: hypothetical protein VHT27_10840 [Solirubrobacteraceae bacterium]|nr:hypothetical protein [Solirubrobacteraceae bacterium]
MPGRRQDLKLIAPAASPEEAAAVIAALERFMRATASAPGKSSEERDAWSRAAILEAVRREPDRSSAHPWINT